MEHDRLWENSAESGHDRARPPVSVRDQAKVTQSLSPGARVTALYSKFQIILVKTKSSTRLYQWINIEQDPMNILPIYERGRSSYSYSYSYNVFSLFFCKSSFVCKCFHLVVEKLMPIIMAIDSYEALSICWEAAFSFHIHVLPFPPHPTKLTFMLQGFFLWMQIL